MSVPLFPSGPVLGSIEGFRTGDVERYWNPYQVKPEFRHTKIVKQRWGRRRPGACRDVHRHRKSAGNRNQNNTPNEHYAKRNRERVDAETLNHVSFDRPPRYTRVDRNRGWSNWSKTIIAHQNHTKLKL
nr:hypothetical protein [Rhizobium leguminosarum]